MHQMRQAGVPILGTFGPRFARGRERDTIPRMLRNPTPLVLASLLLGARSLAADAPAPKSPPKEPARIEIAVSPDASSPGTDAKVTLRLNPADGIKINKYPKIKLKVPGQQGLVQPGEAAIGNADPPPPDKMETNYYKTVDPVELTLHVDSKAAAGRHEVPGQLSYFYCVAASGFCAPAKVSVAIPLTVR